MAKLDEENLIRRFLLGELSPDEHERFEERLFADEEFSILVDVVEEDLIDDFARGKLKPPDRGRFEQQFLVTAERQEHLKFATSLHQALSDPLPSTTRGEVVDERKYFGVWNWLRGRQSLAVGVAFAILLLVSGAVMVWQALRQRNVQQQVAATQGTPAPTPQTANVGEQANQDQGKPGDQGSSNMSQPPIPSGTQTADEKRLADKDRAIRRSAASSFAVVLLPGSLRSEGGFKEFSVPRGVKTVLLKLTVEDDDEEPTQSGTTYEVELQLGEIKTTHQAEAPRSLPGPGGDRFVTVSMPARLLTKGNYQAVLRKRAPDGKVEGIGTYYFNVSQTGRKERAHPDVR